MNLRRVGVLLVKEFVYVPRNFFILFAVLAPILISLLVSLVFGTLFSQKPKLGITDEGSSQIVRMATEVDSLIVKTFASAGELRQAVGAGTVDIGVVFPSGFDDLVMKGEKAAITAYIWGESLLKDRAILATTLAFLTRRIAGQEAPVEIITTTLGDGESIPWDDRLLPLIVLMSIIIGGSMVPASSLVDEKQKRTLGALVVTPTSVGEVFLAKGLLGFTVSLVMGVVTLVLNQAFGAQPLLLLLEMSLGAVMAATLGVLLGAFIKDVNTLFATVKAMGVLLYAPALIYLFPQMPQWIGKFFPTYYLVAPIVETSQRGAGWPDVAPDIFVLIGLILALVLGAAFAARRASQREVL